MRLDAVARFFQDVADDDAREVGLGGRTAWVVRRTRLELHAPARYGERVDLVTWCSGTGPRWAERRTSLGGDAGARVEGVSVWVHVDMGSGAPIRLGPTFHEAYDTAAGGRRVRASLLHSAVPAAAVRRSWPIRFADFDVMGHVNNAAYWQVVEEVLADGRQAADGPSGPMWAEVEYRQGVGRGDDLVLAVAALDDGGVGTWFEVDGIVRATAMAGPLAAGHQAGTGKGSGAGQR